MINLTTWKSYPSSGSAVTTWKYDQRGFLTNKVYDAGSGPITYTNTPAGRLKSRTWARGITTTYTNDGSGQLIGIGYSDATTPNVTFNLDRLARRTNIIDAAGSHFLTWSDASLLLIETNASGPLSGMSLTNGYDLLNRRTTLTFRTNTATVAFTHSYSFDAASRMTNVSDGVYNATYSYLANSPLISQISFKSNSTTRMTTTKSYDYLNRLLSISSQASASGEPPISYSYTYNDANQRIRTEMPDGSYWLYEYDKLGQVTSGKRFWSDGTPVAGQQFEYAFDDIGNRISTKAGEHHPLKSPRLRWLEYRCRTERHE